MQIQPSLMVIGRKIKYELAGMNDKTTPSDNYNYNYRDNNILYTYTNTATKPITTTINTTAAAPTAP